MPTNHNSSLQNNKNLSDSIISKINGAVFDGDGNYFILVDPILLRYTGHDDFFQILENRECHKVLFPHPELENAVELWLIQIYKIRTDDIVLFESSVIKSLKELDIDKLKLGLGRSVCSWISTNMDLQSLSQYISYTAIQKTPSGAEAFVRFFDPAVFGLLFDRLDHWQQKRLLSNIVTWSYIDGDGLPCFVHGEDSSIPKLNFSLGFSVNEWGDVQNIVRINKILRSYRENYPDGAVSELQAARLLYPALNYFSLHFTLEDKGYVGYGVDILTIEPFLYNFIDLKKYRLVGSSDSLLSYIEVRESIKFSIQTQL